MPTRRTRSTQTTMTGNAPIVGAGGTTASRGHKRRRTRRTPQQFGVTRAGNSVTASANLADKVIWDVQQIAGNLTPVQQRAIKHSMNVRLGLV
jgi:hypothetical protein